LSLHKQSFIAAHQQVITVHFVYHCTLKNALVYCCYRDLFVKMQRSIYCLNHLLPHSRPLEVPLRRVDTISLYPIAVRNYTGNPL